MKTNKKFKEFRKEIVDYIDKSKMVKSNQSYKVKQEEKEGYKRLFICKSIKREITQDALWFVDRSFLKFEICLDIRNGGINIWKYSIQWESDDKKNIYYLRYEWDEKISKPKHPPGHLHIMIIKTRGFQQESWNLVRYFVALKFGLKNGAN